MANDDEMGPFCVEPSFDRRGNYSVLPELQDALRQRWQNGARSRESATLNMPANASRFQLAGLYGSGEGMPQTGEANRINKSDPRWSAPVIYEDGSVGYEGDDPFLQQLTQVLNSLFSDDRR